MITRETIKQQCIQGVNNETFNSCFKVMGKVRCGMYLSELGAFLMQGRIIAHQTPERIRLWAIQHDLEVDRGRRFKDGQMFGEYDPVVYFPEIEIELEVFSEIGV